MRYLKLATELTAQDFFFGHPKDCQYYENSGYIRNYDVVAVIDECRNGRIYAQQRNKFNRGDILEVLAPGSKPVKITAETIFNEKDEEVESANHAMMKFSVPCSKVFPKNSILRIKNKKKRPADESNLDSSAGRFYFLILDNLSAIGLFSAAFRKLSSAKCVYISVVAMLL